MAWYPRGDSAAPTGRLLSWELGVPALRLLLLLFTLLLTPLPSLADPSFWVWYPHHRPYQPYGHDVKLGSRGLWVHRDGQYRFARAATPNATIIDPMNSDRRNGRLAYEAAYAAYRTGRENGTNRVEMAKDGRWKKKITTERGIVLLTDDWNNVAVRTPDGIWHVTDAKGRYAASASELPGDVGQPEMMASVFFPSEAPAKAPVRVETMGPGGNRETFEPKASGRRPASLSAPVFAD